MMVRCLLLTIMFAMSFSAQAFQCFITLAKDSCWIDYNVTVQVLDSQTKKRLVTVLVPTGSSWVRQKFTCEPGQNLMFQAAFTPVFWQGDEGKIYNGLHYWNLPQKMVGDEKAWNIPVCFPKQFASVPLPPEAGGKCQCDMKTIPPIPPQ